MQYSLFNPLPCSLSHLPEPFHKEGQNWVRVSLREEQSIKNKYFTPWWYDKFFWFYLPGEVQIVIILTGSKTLRPK